MNILNLLNGAASDIALTSNERPAVTYKQLRENVLELAEQLWGFGLGRGDRVAIAISNSPEMITVFLATTIAATACPLNPKYKQEEFAFYYEDTQAKALIILPDGNNNALAACTDAMKVITVKTRESGTLYFELQTAHQPQEVEQATENDIAMILHTSGTTSRPKRVPIRHRNLIASATNFVNAYSLTTNDKTLLVMPLFHIHGLVGCMLSTFASGGTVICPPGFNALEFWKLVETFKPTWYSAAPTMHQMVLARASRNSEIIQANQFRFIRSSSAPLPPVILEQIEATLHAPVVQSYSMTEAAHLMTTNPLPPKTRKAGSVGYGFGVDVGIMDDNGNILPTGSLGEVVVKGANVIDGYENNPQANATAFVNGWFRTGDQGFLDEEGYLSLTGRLKELINRGGEKISPLEVDDVLLRHPAVSEALAFAVPHKTLGEDIHAAVVLKNPTDEKELHSHCSQMLAEFKVPAKFHILEELPRGATGKLQRLNMSKLLKIE
ncbi:AMP-dependent synthetase [Calothrix sp. HK-06]|nr:AMP-dependent synthetase [Calothrix sp. HK-06]